MKEKPAWLDSSEAVKRILSKIVDKFDSRRTRSREYVSIAVNENNVPELFKFNVGEDADWIWERLKELEQLNLIHLKPPKSDYDYTGARINCPDSVEKILRCWLNRPADKSKQDWATLIEEVADKFPGSVSKLKDKVFALQGKSNREVIQGFVKVGNYLGGSFSQRQISANCFFGLSKYLDGKELILNSLYPSYENLIRTRPILINVDLVYKPTGILIVENQDSFLALSENRLPSFESLILVYSQGFKVTSRKTRSVGDVKFCYLGGCNNQVREFEDHWFEPYSNALPVWFWGDLDYSAMQMLKSLRKVFKFIDGWKPGYQTMVEQLKNGHDPDTEAGKSNQIPVDHTNCYYADNVLLPALYQEKKFLDQEIVIFTDVKSSSK